MAATPLVPDVPTIARSRQGSNDVLDRLWRLLSSLRFALLLIALISVGVLAGTLIMQAPSDIAANPDRFSAWLAQPRGRYGDTWSAVFAALDLYRVFGSLWFRGLLAVLTLSVVVCTVNRAPGIVASVRRPVVRVPERLFERAPLRAEFTYPASEILASNGAGAVGAGSRAEALRDRVRAVLATHRFRTVPWQPDGDAAGTGTAGAGRAAVFADRNRYGKYGTFLNHIGIVSILGAAVMGSAFGWREDGFMVPEGSVRDVGHGTRLQVRSDAFVDEYFPNGTAKDFRSDLVLLEDGREVARKTIRVNDPLEYAGIRFHQAFFGPAAIMRVRDSSGATVFEDGVSLGYEFAGGGLSRNGGSFPVGNIGGRPAMIVYVVAPANTREPDPDIPAGAVRIELLLPRQAQPTVFATLVQGQPLEVQGYTFEFLRERQFSGLQLSYNPAIWFIWVACGLMVGGAALVFYFPLRRVWVRVDEAGETLRVRVAAVTNKDVLFAREFERLSLAIDKELARVA